MVKAHEENDLEGNLRTTPCVAPDSSQRNTISLECWQKKTKKH